MMENQQLVKKSTIEIEKEFLQTLIDSKTLPPNIKSVEIAFTINQFGKELGFQPMQAFHYIISISGRLSLTAIGVGALMRKHNIQIRTIKDFLYVYKDGTESYYLLPDKGDPLDRITELEFSRDGYSERVMFTYTDAKKQDLIGKDNWKRMPREMAYARCLTKGARRIGQDVLMGLYTTMELQEAGLIDAKESDFADFTEVSDEIRDEGFKGY